MDKVSNFDELKVDKKILFHDIKAYQNRNWWDKGGGGRKTLHLAILEDPNQFKKTYRNLSKLIV